jgi:hypothetical protein
MAAGPTGVDAAAQLWDDAGMKRKGHTMKSISKIAAIAVLAVGAYLFYQTPAQAAPVCTPNDSMPTCFKNRLDAISGYGMNTLAVPLEVSGAGAVAVASPVSGTLTKVRLVLPTTMGGTSATYSIKISNTVVGTFNVPSSTTAKTAQVSTTLSTSNTVNAGDILEVSGTAGLTNTGVPGIANTNAIVSFDISPSL